MKHWLWLLPLLTVAAVFALRLAGPPDILDKDQARPIDYILDAAADGNWIVQRDAGGEVCSKPPLYTWLAAGSSLICGGNRFALYLPCAMAMALIAIMAALMTGRRIGWAAGLAAGMAVALAMDTQKAVTLARTDAVFAACVGGAAWLALRAWESGRGWIVVWVMCAVVSLAKSPVGVVFAAGGLLAACWPRERPRLASTSVGQHTVGVAVFVVLAGGWFALAVHTLGQPVIDRMIGRELVGHAIANDNGTPWLQTVWRPPLQYAGLFLPWSILAAVTLWRLGWQPPSAPRRRRFIRFMACWLGLGLLVLCLAPHKRLVLALPMLLPGAVLAGIELGRWARRWHCRQQLAGWAGFTAVILVGLACYHHFGRDPVKDRIDDSRAVIASGDRLSQLVDQGIAVAWERSLPTSIRYFTVGWPQATIDPAAHLAAAGPGAVAVPAGMVVIEAAVVQPMAGGIEIIFDAEAARLAR